MPAFAAALSLVALPALAAMTDEEARAVVEEGVARNKPAMQVLDQLMRDGRSLQEATVIAVAATAGRDRAEYARAGICAAEDDGQAQRIGEAAEVMASSDDEKDSIEGLVALYVATRCEPPLETEPPAAGTPVSGEGTGGVARPPTFPGVRPPTVSPAS